MSELPNPSLRVGDHVRIVKGAFEEAVGDIVGWWQEPASPIVRVMIWGQPVEVHLDPDQVERRA